MTNSIKAPVAWGLVLLFFAFLIPLKESPAEDSVPNQLIVSMLPGKSVSQSIQQYGGSAVDTISGSNIFLITYTDTTNLSSILSEINSDSDVVIAQPNHIIEFPEVDQMSESFPDQSSPTFLQGTSPASYYGGSDYDIIRADSAHIISTGEDVVVAIIDNGIYFDHPLFDSAFQNNGYDFIDNDSDASEDSGAVYGHGTFVAGIIMRVAPDCKLIPLRAFDEDGYGSCYDVARAIYRAIDDSADVINMSFSVYSDNQILKDAISAAYDAGIAMVAAPGNEGVSTYTYPSCYQGVIALSSIDSLDYIADFSNYGDCIDACSPGVNIYSSLAGEYEWGSWSGTSFSAPMASGVCALILSLDPNLTVTDVQDFITKSADSTLQWGTIYPQDSLYGYGRLDALEAVSEFNRGDVNYSGTRDSADIDYLQGYIMEYGPAPVPMPKVGDLDCSGSITISDLIILINYLENGGPEPTPCE